MSLQNIFVTETNNYTKRIFQSHTDHYPTTMAMNWKKLTTEELNRFIGLHRRKTRGICWYAKPITAWSIGPNISKRQFRIKPDMFSHGSQERFCYCSGCLLEVSCFHHNSTNLILEKNTCSC